MHRFLSLAGRFGRDERGVFAVLFGLMAIVLVALSGAVVDYVSLEQTRGRAQIALDAAALALQPNIYSLSETELEGLAQALVTDRIGTGGLADGISAEIVKVTKDEEAGALYLEATVSMPTIFVALVGVNEMSARIVSQATRKKLALEVVMVLDNSGSMQSESRMTRLVDAAKCATYILMYDAVVNAPGNSNTCVTAGGAKPVENVRLGIVPFTMFVNVGTSNANAAWIDKVGASSIHFDNFDNDDDEDRLVLSSGSYKFPTRQTLFSASGESWRGCVEARPHSKTGSTPTEYLDTDDTLPVGGDTLFVPLFSPDTDNNNYVSNSPAVCDRPAQGTAPNATRCDIVEERTRPRSNAAWGDPYLKTGKVLATSPINFVSNALYPNAFYGTRPPSCACRNPTYSATGWTGSGNTQTRDGWCNSFIPTGLSPRELQERICKYYDGVSGSNFSKGPNADCTRTAILPLTEEPADVIATIGNMQAEGGTNIHAGTVWGMRVLSPTAPFTQGGPYNEAISKVMIIMTDGENTDYNLSSYCGQAMLDLNGKCYNTAYGFPYNSQNNNAASTSAGTIERLGKFSTPSNTGAIGVTNASLVTEMNTRTAQTCANAKAAGITVYTIGLATNKVTQSTPAVVQAMLTACASTPDRAYFPAQSSELKAVFESIANELSALRLAL